MDDQPNHSVKTEDQLDQIIADYLAAEQRGRAPPREELLQRYSELADQLRQFFTDHDTIKEMVHEHLGTLTADSTQGGARFVAARRFGDYELLEEIGRGGMGVIYKARQINVNRMVAVKMILAGRLASAEDIERLGTEAEAAANLDHPSIVPVYEFGQHAGQYFYSMGLVEGRDLADKLAEGPLQPEEAAQLIKRVAEAVHYAHVRGVIHRDLKPANILLDENGVPRITDFGLAKILGQDADLTESGAIVGTANYMSPEQATGRTKILGAAMDVYSLGAILYAMLTGKAPFESKNVMETLRQVSEQEPIAPRRLDATIPCDLETICLKCLEKIPGARYQSASDLVDELQQFLDDEPIIARPPTVIDRFTKVCRKNKAAVLTIAAIALCLIVGLSIHKHVRYQSNVRQTQLLVNGMQAARGTAVPDVIQALEQLPRELVLQELRSKHHRASGQQRLSLAYGLARFDDVDIKTILNGLSDAETRGSEVMNIISALDACRKEVDLAGQLKAAATSASKHRNWNLKSRLAIVAWHLGDTSIATDMLRAFPKDHPPDGHSAEWDPVQRTTFITEFSDWCGDLERLRRQTESQHSAASTTTFRTISDFRSGASLALGSVKQPSERAKGAWNELLSQWYSKSPDSGTHSAAGWALKQWGLPLPMVAKTPGPEAARDWWRTEKDLTMIKIPAGNVEGRNRRNGRVFSKVSNEFWLSDREITVRLFSQFIGDDRYERRRPAWDGPASFEGLSREAQLEHPVQQVSWYDAVLFCNWLSEQHKLDFCYEIEPDPARAETYKVALIADANGFRLPKEMEWEYACRAMTTTSFSCGDAVRDLPDYAVYASDTAPAVDSDSRTASVGSLRCNAWGLFDMHGNVWEWCDEVDEGRLRVFKGGCWKWIAMYCRSSFRYSDDPYDRHDHLGFRVASAATAAKASEGEDPKLLQRLHAAYSLARSSTAGGEEVKFLIDSIDTLPRNEAVNLVDALAHVHEQHSLAHELGSRIDAASSDSVRNRHLVVSLSLGITDRVTAACRLSNDPSVRTALIHGYKDFPGDVARVAETIESGHPELRSALCLAIGTLDPEEAESARAVLHRLSSTAQDGGTHSAACWALQQQGYGREEFEETIAPATSRNSYVNSRGITMIKVPGGEFKLGAVDDMKDPSEGDRIETFKPFWMSDREITVAQFQDFVKATDNGIKWPPHDSDFSSTSGHPAPHVSWNDAVLYCNWLSDCENLTRYYDLRSPDSSGSVRVEKIDGQGYRLPTEREWEYACRARSAGEYCFGNKTALLPLYAAYDELSTDAHDRTTEIGGSMMPNGFGLFDLHGNVWEWCDDECDSGTHVIRGGSFVNTLDPQYMQSRYRGCPPANFRRQNIGFRISRTP